MNLTNLHKILEKEPKFRYKQINEALFSKLIDDWQQATSLPMSLQNELNESCPLTIDAELFVSKDQKTTKAKIRLTDNNNIEAVLMRHINNRNTVCVSSQVGCVLDCKFCATGQAGFKRNLNALEIIEQVLLFGRLLKKEKQHITNVVFMGMGEPFLNYENVIESIKILNDKNGFNIGARKISVSTIGIIEGIEKFAQEKIQINLAISLHASNDELRSQIIPTNEKYPIKLILKAVDDYIKQTNRRVMFEYLLIKDINDSDENAQELIMLMKKPLYLVNLIPYNPIGNCSFSPSSSEKIRRFKEILEKGGVQVTQRYRFGQEVKGACGQLADK